MSKLKQTEGYITRRSAGPNMLQKFGFTQYESQVYEAIFAQQEPLDASSIVNHSNVPKAKIYEVLNRLIDKGIVLTTMHGKKNCIRPWISSPLF